MSNINNCKSSFTKKYKIALFLLLAFSVTISSNLFAQAALSPAAAAAISTGNRSGNVGGAGNVRFYRNTFTAAQIRNVESFRPGVTARTLNRTIARLSREGGGVIYLQRGGNNIYNLETVTIRSNIRIAIDPQVTIRLERPRNILFSMGREGADDPIRNVEIVCASNRDADRFTIDFRPRPGIASDPRNQDDDRSNNEANINPATAFRVGYVENFALSGFRIRGNYTTNPSVFLVTDQDRQNTPITFNRIPQNGVIRNASADRIATGYALVQLFTGRNILLENLRGDEGITVRLEPGSGRRMDVINRAVTNSTRFGQRIANIENIRLNNVTNTNGFTSLFLQPHSKICENIDANRINATNAFCAAFITAPVLEPASRRGRFINVNIRSVRFNGNNPNIPTGGNVATRLRNVRNGNLFPAQSNLEASVFMFPAHREAVRGVFRASRSTMPRPTYPSLFPIDGSRVRFASQPSAGVIVASSLNSGNAGSQRGRYRINVAANSVRGTFANANRDRRVIYREAARNPISNTANDPLDCFINETGNRGNACGSLGFGR